MTSFQIKDSLSVQFSKAPAIAIAAPSGGGKTESALRLARGFIGKGIKPILIDTEEKRGLYKKARYQPWDWMDFQPPFTPERYQEALEAVKHYPAVILDSGSHEYNGPGGLQDIQQETLERMAKGDESKYDRLSAPSWKDAKQRHKKFMQYLIRYPTLLIICLRAEPKVKFVKVRKGDREVNEIVDAGYQPICEKSFMFEMLVGAMMLPDRAGVMQHIKALEKDLEPIFPEGQQIDEGTGERLAAWCADRRQSEPDSLAQETVTELLATLDVKTLDTLKTNFETACKAANKVRDKAAKDRIVARYNEVKAALEAQRI